MSQQLRTYNFTNSLNNFKFLHNMFCCQIPWNANEIKIYINKKNYLLLSVNCNEAEKMIFAKVILSLVINTSEKNYKKWHLSVMEFRGD